jgi:hypothetical protein
MHVPSETWHGIEAMVTGYHVFLFGLPPLAKSSKLWQRTDTETSLAPAAALVTACGIGQRSRTLDIKFTFLRLRYTI